MVWVSSGQLARPKQSMSRSICFLCCALDRQSGRTNTSVNTANLDPMLRSENQTRVRCNFTVTRGGRAFRVSVVQAGWGRWKTLTLPHWKGQEWVRGNSLELQGECFIPPFLTLKLLSFRERVEGSRGQKERTKEREAQQGRGSEGERNQKWRREGRNDGL